MPFFLFIYGRRSASASSRTHLLVLTVKLLHNAGIYLNGCSSQSFFHIYFLWMTPFPCPRFFTLRAVLTFSSDSYPHTGQINLSSAFFPYSSTNFNTIKTDTKKASTTSKGVHTRFSFPYSQPILPKTNTLPRLPIHRFGYHRSRSPSPFSIKGKPLK